MDSGMAINFDMRPKTKLSIAIPAVVCASIFMALMSASVKIAGLTLSSEMMIFWRNLLSIILFLPWLQFGPPHQSLATKLKTKEWKLHILRGVTSFLAVYLLYYSLKFLNLTTATLLYNTTPLFIPIISFLWMGIVIHHRLWWALGTGFFGIVLALGPGIEICNPAVLLALLGGIFVAISLLSLRFAHYSEPAYRTLFYLFLICLICPMLIFIFTFQSSLETFHLQDLKMLFVIGIFGFLYQICINVASKNAPMRLLSPFFYLTVIFSMVLDKLIWKTSIPMLTIFGFIFIVLGAILQLVLYPKDDLIIKKRH